MSMFYTVHIQTYIILCSSSTLPCSTKLSGVPVVWYGRVSIVRHPFQHTDPSPPFLTPSSMLRFWRTYHPISLRIFHPGFQKTHILECYFQVGLFCFQLFWLQPRHRCLSVDGEYSDIFTIFQFLPVPIWTASSGHFQSTQTPLPSDADHERSGSSVERCTSVLHVHARPSVMRWWC